MLLRIVLIILLTVSTANAHFWMSKGDKADDTVYDATTWNGSLSPPTKNAIRDKVETMDIAIGLNTAKVSYTPGLPHTPSVKTDDYVILAADVTSGYIMCANKATDMTFTLGTGTALGLSDGEMIGFMKRHATGNCLVAGAIMDNGSSHTLLTGSVQGGAIWLMWDATNSKWCTVWPSGTWTGSTP